MADEAAALEAIAGKLEGRKAELAKLDEQQNPPLPLAQVWSQYMGSPNRPDSGEETLYGYECQWTTFAEWLAKRHPEIWALRQVTKDVAEEYAHARPEGNNGRATRNIRKIVSLGIAAACFQEEQKPTLWGGTCSPSLAGYAKRTMEPQVKTNGICDEARITALGIDHGDAILLQWRGGDREWTCLIDGGTYPRRAVAANGWFKMFGMIFGKIFVVYHNSSCCSCTSFSFTAC